jgi:predicted RNA-binding Zn-ribbon protein involved in translation (DUF1610 family)
MSESNEVQGFCCPACGEQHSYEIFDIEPPAFRFTATVRYAPFSNPKSWAEFMTEIGFRSVINMSMKCSTCRLVSVICPYCSFTNPYEGKQVQRCENCEKKYYTYV